MSDNEEDGTIEEAADEGSNRIAWFITGAVIGATLGLLFAPKSGANTRQLLADTTRLGRDTVNDTSQNLVEAGRDVFERGRKLVEDAAELFERGRKLVQG